MTQISVERVGNRIHIKPLGYLGGSKFADYLYRVKQVPGSAYSAKLKLQSAPLDLEVCRNLRQLFGGALVVGPELTAWAGQERAKEGAVTAVHAIDLGDQTQAVHLPRVAAMAPTMWAAMQNRGYQPVASHFGALVGSHLNADAVGLGKSIETFGALLELGLQGPVILFGPATSLRATWEYEINKWLSDIPGGVRVWVADEDSVNRRKVVADFVANGGKHYFDFLLVNAEMVRLTEGHSCPLGVAAGDPFSRTMRDAGVCDGTNANCPGADKHKTRRDAKYPELFDIPWVAQIGDEMHKYMTNANPRAMRRVSQVGLGIQRLQLANNGVRIALTGTPMKGKPLKLWPVLHWLRPDYYSSEGRFKKQFLETTPDSYAYGGERFLDSVRKDREEAFHRELSKIMIRRTKDELRDINPAWAPPAPYDNDVWVTLGKAQAKQYAQMARSAQVTTVTGSMTATGQLAERTRLKQLAGCSALASTLANGDMQFVPVLPSAKFDWLVELLDSLGITGKSTTEQGIGKVVVASQFTQFIDLWASELRKRGVECFVLTGATSSQDRVRQQQAFQKPGDPVRVFLLNTHAGGTSITLDAADDVVIMDETDNPDDQAQVVGRVHRTSNTTHQVNIWRVFAKGTIDEEIREKNEFADANQGLHLDGRRGVVLSKRTKQE